MPQNAKSAELTPIIPLLSRIRMAAHRCRVEMAHRRVTVTLAKVRTAEMEGVTEAARLAGLAS